MHKVSTCLTYQLYSNSCISLQIEKCKVMCTVYDIDTDYGWYYFGCKVCNHRTFKVVKSRDTTTPTFWCEKCNKFVSNVSPKYVFNLMLTVKKL